MELLTEEKFKAIPRGSIFATGVLPNSPDGLFMTNSGGELRWIAKKGYGQDWAIYCHWVDWSELEIASNGDKVTNEHHIKRCVPCDDVVLKLYRY
jgi:hypothetical protein